MGKSRMEITKRCMSEKRLDQLIEQAEDCDMSGDTGPMLSTIRQLAAEVSRMGSKYAWARRIALQVYADGKNASRTENEVIRDLKHFAKEERAEGFDVIYPGLQEPQKKGGERERDE